MNAAFRWLLHLGLALVLGVLAAWGGVAWLHHDRDAAISDDRVSDALDASDRVQDLLVELRKDGVYVSDDGRYLLDSAGEGAVRDAVRASTTPVYVVVWAPGQEVGADELEVTDYIGAALEQDLVDAGQEHGVLYLWQGPEVGDVVELGERAYLPDYSSASDFTGDPALTLPLAVAAVDDADWDGARDDSDYWGGRGGGGFLGLLLGLSIVGLFLLGGRILRGVLGANLLPGTWRAEG